MGLYDSSRRSDSQDSAGARPMMYDVFQRYLNACGKETQGDRPGGPEGKRNRREERKRKERKPVTTRLGRLSVNGKGRDMSKVVIFIERGKSVSRRNQLGCWLPGLQTSWRHG